MNALFFIVIFITTLGVMLYLSLLVNEFEKSNTAFSNFIRTRYNPPAVKEPPEQKDKKN